MDFSTFVGLPDLDKLCITEHRVGKSLEDESWTDTEAGSFWVSFAGGEVVAVEEDGTAYTEVFSVAACNATASTFYYDLTNERLYVQTSDSDDPATRADDEVSAKYSIVAYFWIGFTNRNETANPVIYERQDELLSDGNFDLWPSADDPSSKYWTIAEAGTSTAQKDASVVYDVNSAYSLELTIDGAGSAASAVQLVAATKPRHKHTIKIKYKMNGGGDAASIRIYDSASNVWLDVNGVWQAGATDISLPNSTDWTEYEQTFVTHASYSSYYFMVRSADASANIWFDYASFLRHRHPLYFLPYLRSDSIPSIYHGVGDYYDAQDKLSFGTLGFINDGWWYEARRDYNWHNKDARIKVGAVGSAYDDLETVFVGRSRRPSVSDSGASLDVNDVRLSDLSKVPTSRFDTTTYPNLKSGLEGFTLPLLLGEKTNISPPCTDTTARTYKISQTTFGGTTYNLESIDAVYKDGVELTAVTDYTTDLPDGEFTLTFDPGSSRISCDAHGLEIDFETDATFSEYAADAWYFSLTVLCGVPDTLVNIATLKDFKTNRTQKVGVYLAPSADGYDALEIIRGLRRSTVFHAFPTLDGKYVSKRYAAGTTATTPRFYTEDYQEGFTLSDDTDVAFKGVVIKYDQDPTSGEWKAKEGTIAKAEYAHDVKETLVVETYLTDGAEAETLKDFYLKLVREPAGRLVATLPAQALNMNPADKGIFSRVITTAQGVALTILDAAVYRILEFNPKDITTGRATIYAVPDIWAVGYSYHSDVTHEDVAHADTHGDGHTDDVHGDVTHEDVAHGDVQYDDHADLPHGDVHGDVEEPHADFHTDTAPISVYIDSHADTAHEDVAHSDSEHGDTSHSDYYNDITHEDVAHADSYI